MSKGGSRRTLLKGGLPSGVPQENGGSYMYNEEHYFYIFFFNFIHDNNKISDEKEGRQPMYTLLDQLLHRYIYYHLVKYTYNV